MAGYGYMPDVESSAPPRRRLVAVVVLSLLVAGAVVVLVLRRRHEFATAFSSAALWLLGLTALMQLGALLARTEAWHVTIRAAGGQIQRRVLYKASSVQTLGSVINGQLGVAARISVLRRLSPDGSPPVPTLIAAEMPIVAVEAGLAALTSFTLVGPLGLPWWVPVALVGVMAAACGGLRRLALGQGRLLWAGLRVMRCPKYGPRVFALVVFAIVAQIMRNWLLLNAVGVHASIFNAVAVLIAVVSLGQLPFGAGVGAVAAVAILGSHGVTASAAAGVLMTVTGTIGGLCFVAWAAGDHAWGFAGRRRSAGAALA